MIGFVQLGGQWLKASLKKGSRPGVFHAVILYSTRAVSMDVLSQNFHIPAERAKILSLETSLPEIEKDIDGGCAGGNLLRENELHMTLCRVSTVDDLKKELGEEFSPLVQDLVEVYSENLEELHQLGTLLGELTIVSDWSETWKKENQLPHRNVNQPTQIQTIGWTHNNC